MEIEHGTEICISIKNILWHKLMNLTEKWNSDT